MIAQLDHLTAVIVGGILLLALFAVQQRSATHAAEVTLTQAARVHADAVLEVVADDVENLLTPAQAIAALGRSDLRLTAVDGRTLEAVLTTNVRTDTTGANGRSPFQPATVTYTLTPTHRTRLGADSVDVFRLDRTVALAAGMETATLGEVVDFDVAFVGRGARVEAGTPDASAMTEAAISLAVAADVPPSRSHDQTSTREALVHAAATVRPVNATATL